ncbi:ABC transporter ATP-binding protein [Acuticoccus sp.]|uniref:ABC transporter ATP-binding protein n=1 Tax=Acuticoccus sp. TaxID=1904378 RepID=UPI003B52B135
MSEASVDGSARAITPDAQLTAALTTDTSRDAPAARDEPLLVVRGLNAYYGKSHVLRGVDLEVGAGEVVALLGRNGVGRSTTVKAIMGEVPPVGEVRFKGESIAGKPSHEIALAGLGYVPENRDIFPMITVRQNLLLGIKDTRNPGRWSVDQMLDLFPNLAARADTSAGVLSGGEKQMLTICRTLMGDPELIMIDEPTEGLAPKIVHQVGDLMAEIARAGVAILLVEQKLSIALKIAARVYVMGHGEIVYAGTPAEFATRRDIREEWLEV